MNIIDRPVSVWDLVSSRAAKDKEFRLKLIEAAEHAETGGDVGEALQMRRAAG